MGEIEKIGKLSNARVPLIGAQTVFRYFSQVWVGRLRLHTFHRTEPGDAFHDHPWSFVTFPLSSYVEQVLNPATGETSFAVLKRFRFHSRPAEHVHRYMGKWAGTGFDVIPGKVYTICWVSAVKRDWKYWRFNTSGKPVGLPWRPYLSKMERTPPDGRDQRQ